jgi:hypothetical protein
LPAFVYLFGFELMQPNLYFVDKPDIFVILDGAVSQPQSAVLDPAPDPDRAQISCLQTLRL